MHSSNCCAICGYDRAGLSSTDRCPECGNPWIDLGAAIDHRAAARHKRRFLGPMVVALMVIVFAFLACWVLWTNVDI